jgi:AraC-like DNA-binding protein
MMTQIVPAPENNRQNGLQENWVFWPEVQNPTSLSSSAPETQAVPSGPKLTPLVYTIEETAIVLNCSTKTVRRLLDRQLLTCCNVLRKKLIPCKQIESFLKATCDVPKGRF